MDGGPRPDPLKALPLLTGAILAGSLLVLGVGFAVQRLRPPGPDLEAVAWAALLYAVACPFAAGAARSALAGAGRGASLHDEDGAAVLRREVVYFAVLESGVVLCAVALMVTPSEWPLFAALAPLAAMILGRSRLA